MFLNLIKEMLSANLNSFIVAFNCDILVVIQGNGYVRCCSYFGVISRKNTFLCRSNRTVLLDYESRYDGSNRISDERLLMEIPSNCFDGLFIV